MGLSATGAEEAMERQAWNRKGGLDRAVLEHARAMLLVLAALVERAAGLPTLERLHFLAVMGHGEAKARRLIFAMAPGRRPGETAEAAAAPTAAGDVALLAARFRMLALAVETMLAQTAPRPHFRHAASGGRAGRTPRRTSQFTPSPARRATSPPQAGERNCGVYVGVFLRTGHAHRSLLVLRLRPKASGHPAISRTRAPA